MELARGLPRKFKIGQYTYRLRFVSAAEYDGLSDAYGVCDHDALRIYVSTEPSCAENPERLLNTVQHELTHAINHVWGIDDDTNEENMTGFHTNGTVALWLDNPKYLLWVRRLLREIKLAQKKDD
jgi:hypothetical protein